jgi:very-short-patch-repair endonuclease
MTPAEKALWKNLKGKQLDGFKFRAQHPVGPFILDFYCPSRKLVVELDGDIHKAHKARDTERTQQLEAHGYAVIRFQNDAVFNDMDGVLEDIRAALAAQAPGAPKFGGL